MNRVTNLWNKVTIYCLNHDEPIPMKLITNTEKIKTAFYACSNYIPENGNEHSCPNRLNLDDYQGLVLQFMDVVGSANAFTDFKNYKFEYKGSRQKITVKCLKYTDKEIRLGIYNNTVFGR